MTKPWAMARVASRRQLPKPRKMMGPVGAACIVVDVDCCRSCGYMLCSCPPMRTMCGECGPIPAGKELTHRCPEPRPYSITLSDGVEQKIKTVSAPDPLGMWGCMSGLNSVARGAPKPDPEAQAEPNPFAEAIDQKIKNVMQSAELYLTAFNLGIDPSTLPGVETKPVEPKPEPIGLNYFDHDLCPLCQFSRQVCRCFE